MSEVEKDERNLNFFDKKILPFILGSSFLSIMVRGTLVFTIIFLALSIIGMLTLLISFLPKFIGGILVLLLIVYIFGYITDVGY